MKVAHNDDYDSHAVIGGKEVTEFAIVQTAEFFTVLSSALYSNKPLAVIREVLCNAWDSHIVSGRTDRPVIVTTTNDKLVIKDNGFGIPHDRMVEIYCTYGASTKANDGKQTGGFGLGSKAPFAYSDHFTVENSNAGTKKVNAISRGSALTEGKPDIRVMVNVPTTDEGVTVSIPIKNAHDRGVFIGLVRDIAAFGEMNVLLDGVQVPIVKISEAEDNLYVTNKTNIPNTNGRQIIVRYGNVLYPVEEHEEIIDKYRELITNLNKYPDSYQNKNRYVSNSAFRIILQAPANSISVTPSRESLSMTDTTINTLKKLFDDVNPLLNVRGESFKKLAKTQKKEIIDKMIAAGKSSIVFSSANLFNGAVQNDGLIEFERDGDSVVLLNQTQLVQYYLAYNEDRFSGQQMRDEQIERLEIFYKQDYRRKYDIQKTIKILGSNNRNVRVPEAGNRYLSFKDYRPYKLRQILIQPLLKKLAVDENLSPKNLFAYIKNNDYKNGIINLSKVFLENWQVMDYLQATVIIAHSKASILESFNGFDNPLKKEVAGANLKLLYIAPRSKDHKENAIAFFTKLGYKVLDFASYIDAKEAAYLAANPAPLPTVTVTVPKAEKIPGLPKLGMLKSQYGFNAKNHLKEEATKQNRIENFDYVMQAKNLSGKYDHQFFPWGDRYARYFANEFGEKIGITVNSTQTQKYLKEGKKDGAMFITQTVCDYILNCPAIIHQMQMSKLRSRETSALDTLFEMTKHSDQIKNLVGLQDKPTERDENMLTMYRDLTQRVYPHNKDYPGWEGIVARTMDTINNLPEPKHTIDLIHRMKDNESKFICLDLNTMNSRLKTAVHSNDRKTKTFIEMSLIMALS